MGEVIPSVFTEDLTASLICLSADAETDHLCMHGGSSRRQAYLVRFSHHNAYYNMRFHELEALADMAGLSVGGHVFIARVRCR